MPSLSQKEKETAKGFLVDLFLAGGLIQVGDTSIGTNLSRRWSSFSGAKATANAKAVCTEIVQRNFDFFTIDGILNEMSNYKFFADPTAYGRVRGSRMITRSAETIAAYIADFCKANGIYWDDINTHKTTYELDQYKNTTLGKALWDYSCFLSQTLNNNSSNTAQASAAPRAKANRTPGQPPANPYKSSGPQSSNIRDLQGAPGQKVVANTKIIFCIMADNAKSSSPAFALIKPLTKGADVNGTNQVFVSSSHGYTDCTCYFDEQADADAFLAKCQARNWGANISNLRVAKKAAEKNGYFLVGTEFGTVAISAKRMNEAIKECAETQEQKSYKINNVDVYAEAFMRE